MCGICGILPANFDQPTDQAMLRKMTDIMIHRGPDGEGYYAAPGIGLGVRRLSIIDLETGDQPIFNEDGKIVLVCNGEIYNYIELRNQLLAKGHQFHTHSDVEVIAHLYEEHGILCLNHLRGMFAFALWDAEKRTLFLARDRLGIKPLHWAVGRDRALYFASEFKSILMAGQVDRNVDVGALKDLFSFGYIVSPKTIFHHIRKMPAGHYALCRQGNLEIKPYWDITFTHSRNETARRKSEDWAHLLAEKLEESVRIHLRSDVPVGAWLSAGIDSSAIAALMARATDFPVSTYSLSFPDQPQYDEVLNQKTLNEFPGYNVLNRRVICRDDDFDLFAKVLWHQENPSSSGNHILQYLLSSESAANFKVVLSGEGADENLGGYPWYLYDKLARPFNRLPGPLQSLLTPLLPIPRPWALRLKRLAQAPVAGSLERYAALIGRYEKDMFDRVVLDDLKALAPGEDDAASRFSYPEDFQRWTHFEKLQYIEIKTRLDDYITHSLDRSSMGHSIEVRVPFLDHEVVEFCAKIPHTLKMHGHREKYILRQALKDVLPVDILNRKKRGLVAPSSHWVKRRKSPFMDEMLSSDNILRKGYFDPDVVARLLEIHRSGRYDYALVLLTVLGVQVWDDLFVKGCRP
jgi:asparagine synthase (glutamine-hydrolysing)